MLGSLSLALFGFLLGVRHAIDPDHVVAVTAIATQQLFQQPSQQLFQQPSQQLSQQPSQQLSQQPGWRRATLIGALWGIGHSVTVMSVGGAIVLFRVAISPRVGLAFEFAVALMLILLGVMNLLGSRATLPAAPPATPSHARPLVVGMMHGLAGSAAIALLVLATVSDSRWALAYLLLFGVGTVVGMMLVTTLIALPATLASHHVVGMRRWLTVASGVVSVVFGLMLARELSGPGGLFSAAPQWIPR